MQCWMCFTEYHWRRCKKLGHHVAKFISRDEILDPENFCLVNDKLTIVCEVSCCICALYQSNIPKNFFFLLLAGYSHSGWHWSKQIFYSYRRFKSTFAKLTVCRHQVAGKRKGVPSTPSCSLCPFTCFWKNVWSWLQRKDQRSCGHRWSESGCLRAVFKIHLCW